MVDEKNQETIKKLKQDNFFLMRDETKKKVSKGNELTVKGDHQAIIKKTKQLGRCITTDIWYL